MLTLQEDISKEIQANISEITWTHKKGTCRSSAGGFLVTKDEAAALQARHLVTCNRSCI